jgi:hypothetical protein
VVTKVSLLQRDYLMRLVDLMKASPFMKTIF